MTNPFQKVAVGNMGEEELERMQRTVLTRDDTKAEADLLFGEYAKDMRKTDKALLEKLFIQTPAAVTMAPNLQKEASMKPVELLKLAMSLSAGPSGEESWIAQFEGTSLLPQAIQLEEQSLQMDQEDIQNRIEEQARYGQQDQERNARWQKRDQLQLQKRVLALELAKEKAGLGAQQEGEGQEQEAEMPAEHEQVEPAQEAAPQGMPEPKTASVTARVDAYFEKLSAPSDAQRRYPELLKAAGMDTPKAVNLKARSATASTGQTAVRSSLSGGSA